LKLTDKQLKLIEKYLDKDLSTAEEKEFQANLEIPEFKDQLLFQSQLVDQLGKEQSASAQNPGPNIRSLFMRLAAAVLLIFGVLFGLQTFAKKNKNTSFEKYYAAFPSDISRSADSASDEYALAMKDYAQKNYQAALDRLIAIPEQNENQNFYIANCYMQLDNDEEALKLFGGLSKSINTKYRHNAEWYSCLIYLENQNDSYKKFLDKMLQDETHMYYKNAKVIASTMGH